MSKKTDNFYNRFSFFYPLVDIILRPQKRRLFAEINALPFGNLLEIGVGDGKHLSLYKSHKITGIDTSASMLRLAKKRQKDNIDLIQMNGEQLLFPAGVYDYVVLSHVIAVVDNPETLLGEIYRVLKPGGKIFILNHFTPGNCLKYLDKSFQSLSGIFHFKSVFYANSLISLQKFTLLEEISFTRFSYFKLLIYGKA